MTEFSGLPKCKLILPKIWVFIITIMAVGSSFANPVLESGSPQGATISQTATTTTINQTSQKAIINWHSFNINSNETTHFAQPTGGVALNRINPNQGASQIFGKLTATGKVVLINQAGIFFASGSSVNVGGLIASTIDMTNENFLAGKYIFDQHSSQYDGSIINKGTIAAAQNGLVALIGNNVQNDGIIQANLGNVVLASGNKFTVNLTGDDLVSFTIDEASTKSNTGITNTGAIYADGGKILMTARAASEVIDNVINMSGIAQAKSVLEDEGQIIISAEEEGKVSVSGELDASGRAPGQHGGTVKILGKQVDILSPTRIDVSGDQGGGKILVGGNFYGAGPERNALNTTVYSGVTFLADALTQGNGGLVAVWSDHNTLFHGSVSAKGGSLGGHGGFVETSGHNLNVAGAKVNTTAAQGLFGTWLLDPTNVTISTDPNSNVILATDTYTPSGAGANVDANELMANLELGNITILTTSGDIQPGDIILSTALTWGSSSTLTLTADNTIYLGADITATNGALHLSSPVTINVSGGATITGNQTYDGNVTLGDNVNFVGSALNFQGLALGLNTATITASGASSIAGAINGTGSLVKAGAGTLNLTAANSFTGSTTVSDGVLQLSHAEALGTSLAGTSAINIGSSGTLNINNVTLDNGNAEMSLAGALTGTGTAALSNMIIIGTGDAPVITASNASDTLSILGTINGFSSSSGDLTLNGSGIINLEGAIGGTNSLASMTTNAATTTHFNSPGITTAGTQTYNGAVVLDSPTSFSTTSGNITFASGISGTGMDLFLSGGSSADHIFTISNSLTANTVNINGGNNSANNRLVLQLNSESPTWSFVSNNAASITNLSGVMNSFEITNIQNVTGGNSGDTFNFSNGASINGSITGGTSYANNILSYASYTTPITLTLVADHNGNIQDNNLTTVTSFTGIGTVTASSNSTLITPNKTNTISISGYGSGSINDPVVFNNFTNIIGQGNTSVIFAVPASLNRTTNVATINGQTIQFSNIASYSGNITNETTTTTTTDVTNVISASQTPLSIQQASIQQQQQEDQQSDSNVIVIPAAFTTLGDITSIIQEQATLDNQLNNMSVNLGCS